MTNLSYSDFRPPDQNQAFSINHVVSVNYLIELASRIQIILIRQNIPRAHYSSPRCLPRASYEDKLVFLGNVRGFSSLGLLSYIITLRLKIRYAIAQGPVPSIPLTSFQAFQGTTQSFHFDFTPTQAGKAEIYRGG